MPHPPVRVRPQRLLADDRAPRQEQPGNASALTGVDDFDPDERLRAGLPSARFHQAPPPTRPGLPISAYTQAEECTTAVRQLRSLFAERPWVRVSRSGPPHPGVKRSQLATARVAA